MEKKLTIKLGENKIVAEVYPAGLTDAGNDIYEMCVYLCDREDRIFQDICVVRPHYHYDSNKGEFVTDNSLVDCLVWGESGNEDYTNKHVIGVYELEDEE